MRIRFSFNNWLFKTILRRYNGIVLYPFVCFKQDKKNISDRLLRHELQHVYQIQREGVLKFYAKYLWFNIRYGYRNNPYEVEARYVQYTPLTPKEIELWRNA